MASLGKITRRTFLAGSAAITGGFLLGYYHYQKSFPNPLDRIAKNQEAVLTHYLKIDQQGITVIVPRAEMGQGVMTTLAALVAEELDVTLAQVKVEHGPAAAAYYNGIWAEEGVPYPPTDNSEEAEKVRGYMHIPAKLLALQMTGGSTSVTDAFEKMRLAGAAARQMLLAAAAVQLGVTKDSLSTSAGQVLSANGKSLSYLSLAARAQGVELTASPVLKPPSEWNILGKSQPRVDMVPKVTGTAEFGIDVRLPGMLHATVKMNPNLEQTMLRMDVSEAMKVKGVKNVLNLQNKGIAVVASNTWSAIQGAKKVNCEWRKVPYANSQEGVEQVLDESISPENFEKSYRDDGDALTQLNSRKEMFSAEYRVPFLSHAPLEPMSATVLLEDESVTIWAATQIPNRVYKEVEHLLGISEENVTVHTPLMGGSFGRRLEFDFVNYALLVAKSFAGTPVKVTWSREEDMTHDAYRPHAIARVSGSFRGEESLLSIQTASPSIMASWGGRLRLPVGGPDLTIAQGAWEQPYQFDHYRVDAYRTAPTLPVSSWRSVGNSQNGFFQETAIDEMCHHAGQDAAEFRLSAIAHSPSNEVIRKVMDSAGWGQELPENQGMGIAFVLSFGVPVAEIIRVEDTPSGLKLLELHIAADVGIALDPKNIEAQLMSGALFGLSAAMFNEITIKDGAVEQSNFHNYPLLRLAQAPEVTIHILQNGEKIRGIGEPGVPPAAPALGNAIFAATGKRIRQLPFNKQVTFA